ncbi:MAG: GNAT family N-acetyltransferase [Chloroflexi bacterium]|nr:GNAT family N-acetyltransferase [Chloroflexota bacterium]MDA1145469.1 GNAT family N-acetyltransferase [Chloroflexota bacterium]
MTHTQAHRQVGDQAAPADYRIRHVRDPRLLEAALSEDRALAAYALGHLEPGLIETADFFLADGPAGRGVVMHAYGMGQTTVVTGAAEAVAAIVSLHPGPRRSYLSTSTPEQIRLLRRYFRVYDELPMRRMALTRAAFQPIGGEVRRLGGRDVGRLNALYASEGGPSFYRADTIDRSVYYGAFDGQRLVAVAGSHVVAPNASIAVVGNVFTAAEYRGCGLAMRTTSAVTEALFSRGCADVVLTVDPKNSPAVRAYQRLGYVFGSVVVEARLQRTDTLGIEPALRRRAARRRGRDLEPPGTEVVPARTGARQ